MGGACSVLERDEKGIQNFCAKIWRKRKYKCEDDIKVDLRGKKNDLGNAN
jgi:hypothetical protein